MLFRSRPLGTASLAQVPGIMLNSAGHVADIAEQSDVLENDLIWVGMIGIIDPPRTEVRDSVAEAHRAGIRTVMITGDHPLTAARIATDLGIIDKGGTAMTGFGHGAVLGVADQVIEAVKSGAIRHFFLVGGCDGARPGRNYYTEFVKQTPADTVVLTLACGKYRFNDLDLGTIGGLPRLMDVGQCNDAYGAVKIALALAEAFGCGVNDLPLSMVLSWYEQKAVCILLTLLYLGIKNIRLGPTLPAFVSPNVLNYLVENFGIAPITTPEEDLKQLLK